MPYNIDPTGQALAISQDAACYQGIRLAGGALVNEYGNPIGAANVWGRRLEHGGLALLFVNTASTAKGREQRVSISCDAACFHASGWTVPAAGAILEVRNVWARSNSTLTVKPGGPSLVAKNISTDGCVLVVVRLAAAASAVGSTPSELT